MSSSSSSSSSSFTLSSVTVAVDKATSELLLNPDWTMIIAICDSLNSHHWQTKDAVRAVKRRLQHKSAKVQLLALTLLEAMVKNCGEYVHFQIAEKHVLGEMVRIVRKKGDIEVRNKILVLLDTWHEAFGGSACKYPHYNWAYEELRRSGVKFPERQREATLMLKTPTTRPSLLEPTSGYLLPSGSFRRLDETMATEIETLSLSSLESMRNVMDLVNDMVQAVNPGDRLALKDEVIVDLVDRCRSNQKKLIQMLTTTADEEVLARGLELNDRMQIVLARHDAIARDIPLTSQAAISGSKSTDTSKKPGEVEETSPNLKTSVVPDAAPSTKSESDEEEEEEEGEDDFAQLARRHAEPRPIPSKLNSAEEGEDALLMGNNRTSDAQAAPEAMQCKELALSDPRTKEEQNIIDLLSLTQSTTTLPSPQPRTHPHFSSFDQNIHQTPFSARARAPPHASGSQDQILLNSYVVPWAQPLLPNPIQPDQNLPSQPQLQQQAQLCPSSQCQPIIQPQPWLQLQYSQFSCRYPPPPWAPGTGSFANTNNNSPSYAPVQAEKQLQHSNSFPIRGSNNLTGDNTLFKSGNTMNSVAAAVQKKPYVPPYRLFEDLNVYWNADGCVEVANNPSSGFQTTPGESMIGGRK